MGGRLLTAVAAAFVPLVWPITILAAVGLAAAWAPKPRLGRATAINAAIVAVVPAAVLVPWTFHLVTSPSAFFLEAGIERPGLAAALRPESVLLLRPGGPGLPPAWVTAGLLLPAFGALLARRRLPLVYAGWAIALGGLAAALVVSRVQVRPPGGTAVSAWPGVAIALAAAGLLLAAVPLIEAAAAAVGRTEDAGPAGPRTPGPADQGCRRRPDQRCRRRPAGRAGLLGGGGLGAVLAAGDRLAAVVRGPVAAAGPQILPPFVASSSSGPGQPRTWSSGLARPLPHGPARGRPRAGEPELPDPRPPRARWTVLWPRWAWPRAATAGIPGRRQRIPLVTCCCPPGVDQVLGERAGRLGRGCR